MLLTNSQHDRAILKGAEKFDERKTNFFDCDRAIILDEKECKGVSRLLIVCKLTTFAKTNENIISNVFLNFSHSHSLRIGGHPTDAWEKTAIEKSNKFNIVEYSTRDLTFLPGLCDEIVKEDSNLSIIHDGFDKLWNALFIPHKLEAYFDIMQRIAFGQISHAIDLVQKYEPNFIDELNEQDLKNWEKIKKNISHSALQQDACALTDLNKMYFQFILDDLKKQYPLIAHIE